MEPVDLKRRIGELEGENTQLRTKLRIALEDAWDCIHCLGHCSPRFCRECNELFCLQTQDNNCACKEPSCDDCLRTTCSMCDKKVCSICENSSLCMGWLCGDLVCSDCSYTCHKHWENTHFCEDCIDLCATCEKFLCVKCEVSCDACGKTFCSEHTASCKSCDDNLCSGCIQREALRHHKQWLVYHLFLVLDCSLPVVASVWTCF